MARADAACPPTSLTVLRSWYLAQDPAAALQEGFAQSGSRARRLLSEGGAAASRRPFDDVGTPNAAGSASHFTPRSQQTVCSGRYAQGGCPDGQVPAISGHALHQGELLLSVLGGRPGLGPP